MLYVSLFGMFLCTKQMPKMEVNETNSHNVNGELTQTIHTEQNKTEKKNIENNFLKNISMVIDFILFFIDFLRLLLFLFSFFLFRFFFFFSLFFISLHFFCRFNYTAMQGKIRHVSNIRNESVAWCTTTCH